MFGSYTKPRYQVSVNRTIGPLVFCYLGVMLDDVTKMANNVFLESMCSKIFDITSAVRQTKQVYLVFCFNIFFFFLN